MFPTSSNTDPNDWEQIVPGKPNMTDRATAAENTEFGSCYRRGNVWRCTLGYPTRDEADVATVIAERYFEIRGGSRVVGYSKQLSPAQREAFVQDKFESPVVIERMPAY